jgi:hypothetical protein
MCARWSSRARTCRARPDQSLVINALEGADRIVATRGDGYAFVYSPQGRKFSVDVQKLGPKVQAWWYNPRDGAATEAGMLEASGTHDFTCPSEGFGSDWVLVLDDAAKKFGKPGMSARR